MGRFQHGVLCTWQLLWLVREWGWAFSTVRGPDQAVCLRMKATTKFACVAKLAVFAIGAAETGIGVEQAVKFCSGRVVWLYLIGWGRLPIEAGCQVDTGIARWSNGP